MGLRFTPDVNASHYLEVLHQAAAASGGKFDVYTHETMPERYHFSHNHRIAPIYVIPKEGYELTNRIENGTGMSKGVSTLSIASTFSFSSQEALSDTPPFLFHGECRTTDMTIPTLRCMPCSSRMVLSRLSPRPSSSPDNPVPSSLAS